MQFHYPQIITNYTLSLKDSFLIKGIAIFLMLWHHLFYTHAEYGYLVQTTAILGKVCVAMFLFVSAYGLTIQFEKKIPNLRLSSYVEVFFFQIKRLLILYINYWFVFVIFVPLGVFFFNRSLQISYGENVNIFKRLIFDMLGMQGFNSYNITWWFYQLIIVLYLLYPILYLSIKKINIAFLTITFLILGISQFKIPIIKEWLFPFSIGISCALNRVSINSFLNRIDRKILFICTSILLLFVIYLRMIDWSFNATGMDAFFTLTLVLISLMTIRKITFVSLIFQYLGKHSMNIFMIHTFIFAYFYRDFIYSFKYPILIFLVLLVFSLGVSVLIEYVKDKLGVYKFINRYFKS